MTPDPEAATPTPFPYGRYLAALLLLAAVLYPLPFFLIRAPHFGQWSTSPYGRDLEYGITAQHIDADVLIYGDSTALYGLDPRRMSQELGVKVFNIPNVLPSLRVTGDLGLSRYLAANKPPRLIVLYLSPWDLDYTSMQSADILYDGDEMLLRHGTAAQIGAFYRTHPAEYLQFPFMFYRVNSLTALRHPDPSPPETALTGGHKQIPPHLPLPANCELPATRATTHLATETARALYTRFNTAATPVLVYIAPIPTCRNTATILANDFTHLPAAAPRLLPPADFVNDGYYAHPLNEYVPTVTDQLTEAVRRLLPTRGPATRVP